MKCVEFPVGGTSGCAGGVGCNGFAGGWGEEKLDNCDCCARKSMENECGKWFTILEWIIARALLADNKDDDDVEVGGVPESEPVIAAAVVLLYGMNVAAS